MPDLRNKINLLDADHLPVRRRGLFVRLRGRAPGFQGSPLRRLQFFQRRLTFGLVLVRGVPDVKAQILQDGRLDYTP
jgi:hypothetical protein